MNGSPWHSSQPIQDVFLRRPWSKRESLGLAREQWGFVNGSVALPLGLDLHWRQWSGLWWGSFGKVLHQKAGAAQ